jgi:hypothetical protein
LCCFSFLGNPPQAPAAKVLLLLAGKSVETAAVGVGGEAEPELPLLSTPSR